MKPCWRLYHAALIDHVSSGSSLSVPRIFPGVRIPGPRGGITQVGSTAWQVFLHALTMKQRVINPRHIKFDGNYYFYNGEKPPVSIDPVAAPEFWPWGRLTAPEIEKFQLLDFSEGIEADNLWLFLVRSFLLHLYQSEANGSKS